MTGDKVISLSEYRKEFWRPRNVEPPIVQGAIYFLAEDGMHRILPKDVSDDFTPISSPFLNWVNGRDDDVSG